jgi:hypothetical protein
MLVFNKLHGLPWLVIGYHRAFSNSGTVATTERSVFGDTS